MFRILRLWGSFSSIFWHSLNIFTHVFFLEIRIFFNIFNKKFSRFPKKKSDFYMYPMVKISTWHTGGHITVGTAHVCKNWNIQKFQKFLEKTPKFRFFVEFFRKSIQEKRKIWIFFLSIFSIFGNFMVPSFFQLWFWQQQMHQSRRRIKVRMRIKIDTRIFCLTIRIAFC